jgi:iron(III) transport system substrate-binding protein
MSRRPLVCAGIGCAAALALLPVVVQPRAQEIASPTATSGDHSWIIPNLLKSAREEGSLTVYSSVNQGEALPLWKLFETATGVKVNYVRGSDAELLGRVALEARARRATWDIIETTSVTRLPPSFLAQVDPPEAKNIIPQARGSDQRWYGMDANYNAPAYNTQHVKAVDLPTTYEGFLEHKEWAGHVAIDQTDDQWLSAIFAYYGDQRAEPLVKTLISTLKPALVAGRLALARDVGSGDYWIALNNYVDLTINVKMSGAPTDYWGVDPTALYFGEIGVSSDAPHPNAARLATNFLLSKEAQIQLTRAGRIPVRRDVPPNPPYAVTKLGDRKVIFSNIKTEEEKKWSRKFEQLFKMR